MKDVISVPTSSGLLERVRDPRDKNAWEAFWARYFTEIRGICLAYLGNENDADDVVQIIFHKFLKSNRFRTFRYEPPKRFRDWLFTVVMNDIRSYLCKTQRRKWKLVVGTAESARALETRVDNRMTLTMLQEVEAAFEQEQVFHRTALSIVERRVEARTLEAYTLMIEGGSSGAEVAAKLKMTLAAVYKARSRVARLIEEEIATLRNAGEDNS